MAFSAGKAAVFSVNDGVSLRNISAFCDNVNYPQVLGNGETTTFGKTFKTYLMTLRDATISVSGKFDPTVDGYLALILALTAATAYEYSPAGTATGNVKYAGTCIITGYTVTTPVGDVTSFTADFQSSDTVTRTVY